MCAGGAIQAVGTIRTEGLRFDGSENHVAGLIDTVAVGGGFERDPAWRVRKRYHGRLPLGCR